MSWSVMVARTRMWRMTVAVMRGGNFEGAAWQRPQLARNRFSPSSRDASSILGRELEADVPPEGASFFSLLSLFAQLAMANSKTPAVTMISRRVLVLTAHLLRAIAAKRSATSCRRPKDLHRVRARTAVRMLRRRERHCGSSSSTPHRLRWCHDRARLAS